MKKPAAILAAVIALAIVLWVLDRAASEPGGGGAAGALGRGIGRAGSGTYHALLGSTSFAADESR